VSADHRVSVATGVAIGVLAGEILGLAATGVWLTFRYRPQASGAFPELAPPSGDLLVQDAHRWLAAALVPTLVVAAVLVAVWLPRHSPGARWRHGLLPSGLVAAIVAGITGFLLPWDQIALWAVTIVGKNEYDGYDWLVGDRSETVRFVIVDGAEVGIDTLRAALAVHLLSGAALVLALGLLAVQPRRSAGGGPNRPST
jgi:quinol-cytochrome oxidoreductase complex cytochrome b subunit